MVGFEGLQQALNKAAEQVADKGASGQTQDVSQDDAQKMKSLLSDLDQGLQQAEQSNQTQQTQKANEIAETDVADNKDKSIGSKILDRLEDQKAKMDEARNQLSEIADKVAAGEEIDPGTLFTLQMKVFEVQHATETATKAGGQVSEDLKKLQSGQ